MFKFKTITLASILSMALFGMPTTAAAGECTNGICGTPDQSGGAAPCDGGICECDGGVCVVGVILVAMTDRGDTYQFADDFDGDGWEDEYDNCPFSNNVDQLDMDGDEVGDSCDSCASMVNPLQANLDGDAHGDACDDDVDGDTIDNDSDNCAMMPNFSQQDTDGDSLGDSCDTDDDDDGILDIDDSCRLGQNDSVTNERTDTVTCDDDLDGDGVNTGDDNCPNIRNPERNIDGLQLDADNDGIGDACDWDIDGDGFDNFSDNCPGIANPSQIDLDRDGLGDGGAWPQSANSCDSSECYVLNGNGSLCLSPQAAFNVYLGLVFDSPLADVKLGDEIILPLFSNRLGAAHQWTTIFDEVPGDSAAIIKNARGSGSTLGTGPQVSSCNSADSEGRCTDLNTMSFSPDVPGYYSIKVNVELPEGDPMNLGASYATATIGFTVEGDESAGGCAATATTPATAAMMLLGLFFVRRRKKS